MPQIRCRVCNSPLAGLFAHVGCVAQVKWGMGRRGIGKPKLERRVKSLRLQRIRLGLN